MPAPDPDPWVAECRSAAARLPTVPALVPDPVPLAPRPPVPDASPRGLRRAAGCVAWGLALFALALIAAAAWP